MYIARRSRLSECVQSAQDCIDATERQTLTMLDFLRMALWTLMNIKLYPMVCVCALLCQACMQSVCVRQKLHHALLMAYVFLSNSI